MKVKAIRSEEKVTLSEVREVLAGVEAGRLEVEKEMPYELRRSIEHANTLARLPAKNSRLLAEDLAKLEKMKPDIAFRIASIAPRSRDELRAIFAKEKFSLTGEELDEILEMVASHL